VTGGALPEHAQQEGGEKRRVDEAEDELQRVHDVVEADGGIGGAMESRMPPTVAHRPTAM
jgi:hypothetical protein